ncbi:MAG: S24 family peptidase [Dehalococcoidales bacterium]|nr:S24 family peptidase [Dehalococcoidales bacterium]MDP6577235.1 S24 family peptidase [Dehalococcoidales bacterium]
MTKQIFIVEFAGYHLNMLMGKGYIRRHSELAYGIELLNWSLTSLSLVLIPVIGQIATGAPIPLPTAAIWNVTVAAETLELTVDLTRGRRGIYALKIKGWPMVDALINDGDIVLLRYLNAVENGEMAAVWLEAEKEATLKKVYVDPGWVRLQPANRQM